MISRSNEYKIVIATATQSTTSLMNVHIPYIGSASFKDHLVITNSKIELICRRSAKVKLDDIFYNNNSSLYQQITKALLCYYGLVRKYYPIVSIKIERSGMQGILETYIRSELEISQPLEPSYVLHYKLSETALQNILQETDKATLLRNALSHYLVANAKENEIQRFEKLWKSFNAVYKAMTGKNTDKDALIELRIFALQNKGNLIHSNKVSKCLTMLFTG
ncbi:MAG: hypothetical protein EOO85_31010 [Pedobacter sp.]|nr:MAG: hypothetical protein EOO85_31010 [Pedobacter sp.]